MSHHQRRRSPDNFRGGGSRRAFDSPPRHGPGGGFRPMGGRGGGGGGGGRGFEHAYDVPPPLPRPSLSGQKRGFGFSGRGSSPEHSDGGSFAKLFVGSVPRTCTEEDIRPVFEQYGNVVEVALIKDKRTGQQQGCCFIKYATPEDAERAIRALHNQYTLPGGGGPIQVRYADGERERLGAVEFKLFVGSINKQATEKEVEQIFLPYGRVEDVYLMRDESKHSRGCGFVKYASRDMALAAINSLNGIYTMRGCDQPLTVRFADPKRSRSGDRDSRGGPATGGPGFSPRFQPPVPSRPPSFGNPTGERVPPNAWQPMSPHDIGSSPDIGGRAFGNQFMPRSGDLTVPPNPNAPPICGPGGPANGLLPGPAVPPSSVPQQTFNQPFQQYPSFGQPVSPMQRPLQSPQHMPPPMTLQPQTSFPRPHPQASYAMPGQLGQMQSATLTTPLGQTPLTQQPVGMSGQLSSAAQPSAQQTGPSALSLQTSVNTNLQPQPMSIATNQQQLATPMQQQMMQPLQQSPSPLAQMLSQQTQSLQATLQSSQQAFSQLQQQLQMMQPSSHNVPLQQNPQTSYQQAQLPSNMPQAVASAISTAAAAEAPSSASAAPVTPAVPVGAPVKCTWTEHTSPDGFKYYYNSVTGESRWLEPEELTIFKQQQQQQHQQQKPPVQQHQTQSQPQLLSTHQVLQGQQLQLHAQVQGQGHQPLQQSSLTSTYQASGVATHQTVQELGYSQFQVPANSVSDPSRFQQVPNLNRKG